jgi:DnaJ family protein C protein 19
LNNSFHFQTKKNMNKGLNVLLFKRTLFTRFFHSSTKTQNATLLAGGLSVAAAALAARFALQVINPPPTTSDGNGTIDNKGTSTESTSSEASSTGGSHKSFGALYWARQLYKGGFDDKMTRREAALILGVRESADSKRVQERHRKMLIANHPDHGGSTFLAGKINEAKDVLLKGSASTKM